MNISGQAFDTLGALLNLLANPKAYEQQLTELRKATDENKKYVELIAPAGEIMNMLEAQRIADNEVSVRLMAAQTKSENLIAEARQTADELRSTASNDAAEIRATANEELGKVKAEAEEVRKAKKVVADAKKVAEAANKALEATEVERAALAAERVGLVEEQAALNAVRVELTAKLDKLRDL